MFQILLKMVNFSQGYGHLTAFNGQFYTLEGYNFFPFMFIGGVLITFLGRLLATNSTSQILSESGNISPIYNQSCELFDGKIFNFYV